MTTSPFDLMRPLCYTDQCGLAHQCWDCRTSRAEEGVGLRMDWVFYDSFAHFLWWGWKFKSSRAPLEWAREIAKFSPEDARELRRMAAEKAEEARLAVVSRHQPDTTGAEL